MSASESRTSPARTASNRAAAWKDVPSCTAFQRSFREVRSPQAMLTTWPMSFFGDAAARRLASTTLSMKQKSRVCSPSPKIVAGSFRRAALMNFGMTAA